MECKGKHRNDKFVRCGGGTYICPVCHNKGCLSEKCSNNAFSGLGGSCLSCGAFGKHMMIEKYERQSRNSNKQSSEPNHSSSGGAGIGFGLGFLFGKKQGHEDRMQEIHDRMDAACCEDGEEEDYENEYVYQDNTNYEDDDFDLSNRYDNEPEEEEEYIDDEDDEEEQAEYEAQLARELQERRDRKKKNREAREKKKQEDEEYEESERRRKKEEALHPTVNVIDALIEERRKQREAGAEKQKEIDEWNEMVALANEADRERELCEKHLAYTDDQWSQYMENFEPLNAEDFRKDLGNRLKKCGLNKRAMFKKFKRHRGVSLEEDYVMDVYKEYKMTFWESFMDFLGDL